MHGWLLSSPRAPLYLPGVLPPHVSAIAGELTGPMRSASSAALGAEVTLKFDPLAKVNQAGAEFRAMLQRPHLPGRVTAVPVSEFERLLAKEFRPSWNQPGVKRFGATRAGLGVLSWTMALIRVRDMAKEWKEFLNEGQLAIRRSDVVIREDMEMAEDILAVAATIIERIPPDIDKRTLKTKTKKRVKLHGYSRRAHN